jgi:hypothetical protein
VSYLCAQFLLVMFAIICRIPDILKDSIRSLPASFSLQKRNFSTKLVDMFMTYLLIK